MNQTHVQECRGSMFLLNAGKFIKTTRFHNLAPGRRCSAKRVLCFPFVTPFKEVSMPFNYANAVTKRGHAFAVPLAMFSVKPARPLHISWKCSLRGSGNTQCEDVFPPAACLEVSSVGPVHPSGFQLDVIELPLVPLFNQIT
jgi:hypothetical protein